MAMHKSRGQRGTGAVNGAKRRAGLVGLVPRGGAPRATSLGRGGIARRHPPAPSAARAPATGTVATGRAPATSTIANSRSPARATSPTERSLAFDFGAPIDLDVHEPPPRAPRRALGRGLADEEDLQPTETIEETHDDEAPEPEEPAEDEASRDEPEPEPTSASDEGSEHAMSVEDEELQQDLQRLWAGKPAPAARPPVETRASEQQTRSGPGEHEVFERMDMSLATTFDVGAFSLERRFDELDRILAREERAARPARVEPRSPEMDHAEAMEDLAYIRAASAAGSSVDLILRTPPVPTAEGISPWAAAAATLIAWRHGGDADPAQIAGGEGPWQRYAAARAASGPEFFEAWELATESRHDFDIADLGALLERFGPLWVSTSPPGKLVRVVTGLRGDGSLDGTEVHFAGVAGHEEHERARLFLARPLFVAHLREARRAS